MIYNKKFTMEKSREKITDLEFENADFTGPPYYCLRCGYITDKISSYKSHLKRQNKCEPRIFTVSTLIICDCLEEFGTKTALEKHKEICSYLQKKKALAEKNIIVMNGIVRYINTENNTSIFNIQSPHPIKDIALHTYSLKNKFLFVSSADREFLLNEKYDSYKMYFELTYCNRYQYHLHSLYYPDIQKNTIYAYNGTDWELKFVNHIMLDVIKYISQDLLVFITDYCRDNTVRKTIKDRIDEVYDINDNVSSKYLYDEIILLQHAFKKILFRYSPLIKQKYEQSLISRSSTGCVKINAYSLSTSSESDISIPDDYTTSDDFDDTIESEDDCSIPLQKTSNNLLIPYPQSDSLFDMTKSERYSIFNSDEHPAIVYFKHIYCNDTRAEYQKLQYESDKNILIYVDNKWHSQNARNTLYTVLENEHTDMMAYVSMISNTLIRDKICSAIDITHSDNIIISMIDILKKGKETKSDKTIKSKKISRYIPDTIRENIMKKQKKKCANSPKATLRFIGDYKCPRWETSDGSFSRTNYELDHILEISVGGTNDENNLQYLCLDCHNVKTKNFIYYEAVINRAEAMINQARVNYHSYDNIIDTESGIDTESSSDTESSKEKTKQKKLKKSHSKHRSKK